MVSVFRPTLAGCVYSIGDLHGNVHQLKRILKRILPLRKCDKLIFLGDYCDRGLHTPEVLDILIDLRKKYNDNQVIFIRGNHESMILDSVMLGKNFSSKFDFWHTNGGQQTLLSYLALHPNLRECMNEPHRFNPDRLKDIIPKEHLEFLENELVDYYEDDKFIMVHGGCDPTKESLKDQTPEILYWDRSLFEYVKAMDACDQNLPWSKKVITGHNTNILGSIYISGDKFAMIDSSAADIVNVMECHSGEVYKAQPKLNRLVKVA